MDLNEKLKILSDAAKYDVSCSSSGSTRKGQKGNLGAAATSGICHSFTPDGRCISLLKILLTNYCIYDCAYCINRRSNDVQRASFTPQEIINLTINFYRRNYIEGLFLSSAIIKNSNHTMEMLLQVAKKLRLEEGFNGYIHMKAIPGASEELIHEAGLYVDRMSVNIELPSENSLKLLAPDKDKNAILAPMRSIGSQIISAKEARKTFKKAPLFVPGGQSTQLIIGATPETDLKILNLSENLYNKYNLKRVYYSAYTPVNTDSNLPELKTPPTLREHRLYQGDWLLRFYGFKAHELLSEEKPQFDIHLDPKCNWALNNLHLFPVEINKAPYEMLLRVPGIGIRSAKKIVISRRIAPLNYDDLKKLGIVLKRAQFFITCNTKYYGSTDIDDIQIRRKLVPQFEFEENIPYEQLSLFTLSSTTHNTSLLLNSTSAVKPLLLQDSLSALTGEL
ncbi:putative DNA modification/repair radical SAM protein [Cellulosilyticum ruminicola]|uniref:putative DNA modification/repair radical SAM protein n=1 Tax=Cellulosilyticum ruminicola TaxID=425254 RepID=UPI0006D16571|nr:putative DNA modification/repair radical SAM protein [Cellulosilyticum ruminicola]